MNATGITSQDDLTDRQHDLADAISDLLEADPDVDYSPSQIARKVCVNTTETRIVLTWLTMHHMVLSYGNGAWKRYQHRPLHTPVQ